MTSHPTPAESAPGWRKRHPVLARAVLYGLGAVVVAAVLWLLFGRQEEDRRERLKYLWSRLDALPVVLQTNPDGPAVLEALDQEFSDPSLPPELRSRVARLRAVVARNRKDLVGVNREFTAARGLSGGSGGRPVLELEWAQCQVDLGDAHSARALLAALPPVAGPAAEAGIEALLRAWVEAQVAVAEGRAEEARARLHLLLESVSTPFPVEGATLWFLLRPWTAADVAVELSSFLVAGLPAASPAAVPIWTRLARLGARHFDALLVAAEGLLAAGDKDAARSVWGEARRLDAPRAREAAQQRPTLRDLSGA